MTQNFIDETAFFYPLASTNEADLLTCLSFVALRKKGGYHACSANPHACSASRPSPTEPFFQLSFHFLIPSQVRITVGLKSGDPLASALQAGLKLVQKEFTENSDSIL